MKRILNWVVIYFCLLVFALLVDHGKKHLGVPDYLWLSLNLTLFLYFLARLVGQPLASFLESRREGIRQELEQAQEKLRAADKLRADVVKRLDEVEGEVSELKERAECEGQAEAERIAAQAEEDQVRFLKRVDQEIARRQVEARQTLARETAALTAQLTRELLSTEMTADDRKRVLDRSLAAIRAVHEKE